MAAAAGGNHAGAGDAAVSYFIDLELRGVAEMLEDQPIAIGTSNVLEILS